MIYIYFKKSGFGTFHLRGCQRIIEPVSTLFFINQLNFATSLTGGKTQLKMRQI